MGAAGSASPQTVCKVVVRKTAPHAVADEVFVVAGTYVDPGVEQGRAFGPGSYLFYPAGTEHHATGCTILVWSTKGPAPAAG